MEDRTLILGACGQIGTELVTRLRKQLGNDKVVASDIRPPEDNKLGEGPFELIDATDYSALEDVIAHYEVHTVYLMAAMLSATAEKFPMKAWNLNMNSLFNVLNLAKEQKISKVFWPSSIAVFGPDTPEVAPQQGIIEPNTVYGISKLSGEHWCNYYCEKYNVDIRSIRYPGLISWKTAPGGGTTDYAIAIYKEALEQGTYKSYLKADSTLPMMYMDDAIDATLQLMNSDKAQRGKAYNIGSMSISPADMEKSIQEHLPEFNCTYQPDFRQPIADSWPSDVDDSDAKADWNWNPRFDLKKTTQLMLDSLRALNS
jgi:nucleoside-diphosphate-sugar epimerase